MNDRNNFRAVSDSLLSFVPSSVSSSLTDPNLTSAAAITKAPQGHTAFQQFAGLHLSGPNAGKTAVVVLAHTAVGLPLLAAPLRVVKVYEKIGAFGSLFSDERLCEILSLAGPFREVFVDCPLSLPPCVACTRPVCPGAMRCEDVSVAYMLSISNKVRRRGARKARPINPQSQRLWDVLQLEQAAAERLEPSYSANLAPLVARALTLQRRLKSIDPHLVLKETHVAHALDSLRLPLGLSDMVRTAYRSFEGGLAERQAVWDALVDFGLLAPLADDDEQELGLDDAFTQDPVHSVESFHAFMTAMVAALHHAGLTTERPPGYIAGEGWVYLPAIEAPLEPERARYFE